MRTFRTAWLYSLIMVFVIACGASPTRPDKKVGEEEEVSGPGPKVAKATTIKKKTVELSEEAKEAFAEAVADYNHQKKRGKFDYQALLVSFEQALERDPRLAEAHYNLGCIYEAMRDDKKAVEHYKKALEIRPDLAVAAANWGALLDRHGRLDQALQVYKRALSKDSKNSAVLLNIASIYSRKKMFDEALSRASAVLIRDPTNVGAYRIMASLYLDKGNLDMAHLICLQGLRVKDKDPRLLNTLGLVLLKLKKIPEALAQFRAALAQVPDMIPTRFNVAKIALDYKDFRVAAKEFKKILEYQPRNCKAAIGEGIALRGGNKFDESKRHFADLARKKRCGSIVFYWLANLEFRNFNNRKGAGQHLKKYFAMGGKLDAARKLRDEIKQNILIEGKMREAEKKMQEEMKREEARQKRLADARAKKWNAAYEKAKKQCRVIPPGKLDAKAVPFVLLPPAVNYLEDTNVTFFGMEFKGIKKIMLGNIPVRFKQKDKYNLVVKIPKWLGLGTRRKKDVLGPWDVMIIYKDKKEDPMIFTGGLWVGEKDPKCKTKEQVKAEAEKKKKDEAEKKKKEEEKKKKAEEKKRKTEEKKKKKEAEKKRKAEEKKKKAAKKDKGPKKKEKTAKEQDKKKGVKGKGEKKGSKAKDDKEPKEPNEP